MWIKDLIIQNVQCFKGANISFSKRLNVIIGKNNSGKSTILRSLLHFQSGAGQKPELLLRKFERDGLIFATIVDAPFIPTGKRMDPSDCQAMIYDFGGQNVWTHFPPQDFGEDLPAFIKALDRNGNIMGLQPYPDSEPNNIFIPFLAKRKSLYNHQGLFDEQSVKKIETDFRNLSTKLNRALSNTLSHQFENACREILNFVPRTLPGQQNMNLAMIGQYVSPEENITLDQMGDGVFQTIGFLVNLFQAKNKIFVIEEIENDLHPEALKKILELIIKASAHNQVLISTHSNIVIRALGSVRETKIFETKTELKKDEGTNTELFTSTISLVDDSPDERIRVLSDLGYELSDSHLYDGYLILEEPSAEHIILNFLIPHFTPKLVGRLRTIAAKGADDAPARFHQLHATFTYIHTAPAYRNKAWVLLDGDVAGKKSVSKLQESFKQSWDPSYFKTFSKNDFEEFYPSEYAQEIDEINYESDGKKRGTLKLNLAKKIVTEYLSNPEAIAKNMEGPFKEVISIIKAIEKVLLEEKK